MSKVWEFFENLDEYVYVADIDTHELIYINKKLEKMLAPSWPDGILGRKCYEVLQRCAMPCAMCNNQELKPGTFKEWQYYNPVWDKNLSVKDTLIEENGRRYRMEMVIDIRPQEWKANAARGCKDLEAFTNEALRIALKQETPDESIMVVLEYLGRALNGERTYIYERNEKGSDDNTYEWVAYGVTPVRNSPQNLPTELCTNWYRDLSEGKYIVIKDPEEIRESDPLQYAKLKRQNIRSLFVVPLYDGKRIIGFYGVDNPSGKYLGYVSDILQMMADFIVASINRRDLILRVQQEEADRAAAALQKEVTKTLTGAKMGIWSIIIGEGEPKFVADSTTAALIGVPEGTDPEKTYAVWYANVDKDYAEGLTDCMKKILSGKSAEVVYSYHHPVRGVITIRCGGILDTAYEGAGKELKGYHQDISEYKNSLSEQIELNNTLAARAQENLDMVNDIIGSGLWYMDFNERGEMTHVSWSETFRRMLGFNGTEEFPDTLESWSDRLHPEDKDATMEAYWGCVAGENDYDVTYRLMKKDGEYEWFHARGRVAHYADGAPRLFLGTFINITKERQARKALDEAYEAANRANAAKSEFLSSMSHDIRTPLNAIIGMTAIAAANITSPDKVRHCLTEITASSKHLLGLINEVLDMNKIESGKVNLNMEEFNLADLIDDFVSISKPLVSGKHHTFNVNIRDIEHENVIGDRERLQQSLMNFMSNAVKYTPEGGKIALSIRERPTNRPRIGCYEFVFEDNGIGMSKEFIPKLFDPFTRADDERAERQQGTGLGMSITRNVIRMMNGDIQVESELNKGSRFTATVFMELQNADENIRTEELANLPVLVADDDPIACESTCFALDELGMKGEWVLTGREAIVKVVERHEAEDDYFAVIVDWKMPDMDGIATTRAIRAAVGDEVPIIIISAYDWSDIEEEARMAGANAFIGKPIFKSRIAHLFWSLTGKETPETEKNSLDQYDEASFRGKRVLLVEDNELNAEIAGEILEMTGLEVDHAWNGREAVDKVAAAQDGYYDLVFMDIQMPGMNGYETTETIRAMERPSMKSLPIVAMSANAFAEDVQMAKAAGMDEHVAKPLDFERLLEVLNRFLGNQGNGNQTENR